jgi:hypothetical protein
MGHLGRVADEGAVADIAVLQGPTVNVRNAVTVHCRAHTRSRFAEVTYRTGVRVIAIVLVRFVEAPFLGADIVGAAIAVVAGDRTAYAVAGHAVVGCGARVVILALAHVQSFVLAAILCLAAILRALVVVIARGFIHDSVAVVVDSIACFRGGYECVAYRKPLFLTDAQPRTGAEIVAYLAWRMEAQFHRFLGARAAPRLGHALPTGEPI